MRQRKTHPFSTVLEDIDWLWNEWWIGQPDKLTDGHLRRGSATLRLLLVEGLLGKAWRYYGFERQPRIIAPDMEAIAADKNLRLDLAAGCVAGGGRQNGVDMWFIGGFRIDNLATGVPADAAIGFAVLITTIARIATDNPPPSPLDAILEREWYITDYLQSAGAVRKGQKIARQEIIEYFRNYAGGVHHGPLRGKKTTKNERYELVADLQGHVIADVRDGLYFELLSIGQAVARSADVRTLAEKIRLDS